MPAVDPTVGSGPPSAAPRGRVVTVDQLATSAGLAVLHDDGNAVDAALATSAMLAVTSPHLCGMGGDLLARVHPADRPPTTLNASGGRVFATWTGDRVVVLEEAAPPDRAASLRARGHVVQRAPGVGGRFGRAQIIERRDQVWAGAAEPQALIGAAAGY